MSEKDVFVAGSADYVHQDQPKPQPKPQLANEGPTPRKRKAWEIPPQDPDNYYGEYLPEWLPEPMETPMLAYIGNGAPREQWRQLHLDYVRGVAERARLRAQRQSEIDRAALAAEKVADEDVAERKLAIELAFLWYKDNP